MKGASAESRKNNSDAETSLIFISPRFSMIGRFGLVFLSSRTRFLNLGFGLLELVLKPALWAGLLYSGIGIFDLEFPSTGTGLSSSRPKGPIVFRAYYLKLTLQ